MFKALTLNTEIPANRELRIKLPADVPTGSAEIIVTVSPSRAAATSTLGDLVKSEFFGMWRDRDDNVDSLEFTRKLRSESWDRSA